MNDSRTIDAAGRLERLLLDMHYALIRLSRDKLRELNMTPPRFHLLSRVIHGAPLDMGTLHDAVHVSKSTLTSVVDGLVADGLIERDRSPTDRRRVVLTPTEEGRRVLDTLRQIRCSHLEHALATVPIRDLAVVERSLDAVVAFLKRADEGDADGCTRTTV
ncbi:MAG: MarR family transcriptional regulator [Spirochaetaceae bacterium]|nr:MAG: MarR family transcriptional regulator [Spirochaetaceae bacterium]